MWPQAGSPAAPPRTRRALARLAGLDGVPQLLGFDGAVLEPATSTAHRWRRHRHATRPGFRAAHCLLRALRARGLAHNDLAKEANWLVRGDGSPAVVDFQICWLRRRRGRLFRLLAREDLRHLLKHKRSYCAQALTPCERRLLGRRSWIARGWSATGKRIYKHVARRWFGYWDKRGRGRIRDVE